jgi:hypothetical protein
MPSGAVVGGAAIVAAKPSYPQLDPKTTNGLKKGWKAVQDRRSDCGAFITRTLEQLGFKDMSAASLYNPLAQPGTIVDNAPPDSANAEVYTINGHAYVSSAAMDTWYLYATLIHESFHYLPGVDNYKLQDAMAIANAGEPNRQELKDIQNPITNFIARHCDGADADRQSSRVR